MLVQEVTEKEIKDVLFAMPNDKSPGPDGYTVEFFKESWLIVGKDLVTAIQSFFLKSFIPKGVNATILALIPKTTQAIEMKDYRPISCCNVVYKIISKILANRLKRVLPKFISPNQSAFVKDRLLMENVLLASELVKNYHKDTVSARSAMKIDISKAFDSVQWPFLISTLSALHLPQQFIKWIELCVTTASFSVQVNGELSGLFKSERGLRQGCALSPYLFVICMNVLSKMLDRGAADQRFGFHPYCKNVKLTHLCFADDMMVFTDGRKRSIEGVLEVFKSFAEVSGLNISLEKSTLFMAGVIDREKEEILQSFPFATGSLPVRYLGLPLLTKKMSVNDYTPLLEKIRSRISSWTSRHLSFAGRLQLINSVIHSLTNFWIAAFKLPSECLKEIDKLCSAFLWSGPALNPKKAKIAWEEVCKPKEEGGLGVKSLKEANKVSCLKLIWRIVSADSLWVQWIRMHLIRKGSFWSVQDTTTKGSWMWRKLLKCRALADEFVRVNICGGNETKFWYDKWSPMGRLLEVTGERGCIDLGIRLDMTVAEVVQTHRRRRHRISTLDDVEDQIDGLRRRGLLEQKDTVLWKSKGDQYKPFFDSRNTWKSIRVQQPHKSWYKGIWFPKATPKYTFFAWLAIHNRLTTGDRMLSWNMGIDPSCVLCQTHVESRDHLYFQCAYTQDIWERLVKNLLGAKFTSGWGGVLELITDDSIDQHVRFLLRYSLQISIHTIWRERNGRKHGDTSATSLQLSARIDKGIRNRLSTIRSDGNGRYASLMELWFGSR